MLSEANVRHLAFIKPSIIEVRGRIMCRDYAAFYIWTWIPMSCLAGIQIKLLPGAEH